MIQRPKLKDFPYAGHEKDQAEHEPRKENGPGAIGIGRTDVHWFTDELSFKSWRSIAQRLVLIATVVRHAHSVAGKEDS